MLFTFKSATMLSDSESEKGYNTEEEENIIKKREENIKIYRERKKLMLINQQKGKDEIKIESVKENKINIIEYLGKLGKIVTSIVNNDYTKKVECDLLKEYIKVENMLKNQLKNDGKDVIDKKGKRWNAKKFFLTIPYNRSNKKDIIDYYLNNPKMNICKAAVAQEVHKKAKIELVEKYGTDKHLHVYLEFAAKKDVRSANYFNLPEEYSKYGNINVDIESIRKRTKENIYGYMLKSDNNTYSYGFNIRQDAYGKMKQKEIWYKYAIGEWDLGDVVKYDPSYLTKNISKLDDRLQENMKYLKKYFHVDFVF
jgi:hypothetical protein